MVAYTDRLRLEKQATNTNQNTWGSVLNSNVFDLVDEAVGGVETIALTGANVTLSTANGGTDQARNQALRFTGTGSVTITIPSVEKTYVVQNASNGDVTFSAGGVTATVAAGDGEVIYSDGTDCFACLRISSKIAAAITPVANAGTVKITVDDTTGKYLNSAINVSGLTKTVQNAGSAETLLLTASSDYELISSVEASSSAALVFTGIGTAYSDITFSIEELVPVTDNTYLYMNTSSAGSTFASTGIHAESLFGAIAGTPSTYATSADTSVKITPVGGLWQGIGNATNEGLRADVSLQAPYASTPKRGHINVGYGGATANAIHAASGEFTVTTTSTIKGVQFFMSSGAVKSGIIRMYGRKGA